MHRNDRVLLLFVFATMIAFAESRTASADDGVRLPAMPEMEFKMRRWSLSSVAFSPKGQSHENKRSCAIRPNSRLPHD